MRASRLGQAAAYRYPSIVDPREGQDQTDHIAQVRGDANPADLLTKFMTGKDKIDQLIKLYGLVAMNGCAKSAPLLRKKKLAELPGKIWRRRRLTS